MSIQIPITRKEVRAIGRVLAREGDIICLGEDAYLKTLLVARDRLLRGLSVKATIVKPGETRKP